VTVAARSLAWIRSIAVALPEVNERWSHGAPCFFVRNRHALCYYHDHHGDNRVTLWCPAPPGVQEALVVAKPDQFFTPPTSASGTFSNWLGVFLDTPAETRLQREEIAAILDEAFRLVAPRTLVAELDAR
jgi:hypothetical protein